MNPKFVVLASILAGICNIDASHLGSFHGLRPSASLAKQHKKKSRSTSDPSCGDLPTPQNQNGFLHAGEGGEAQSSQNAYSHGLHASASLARKRDLAIPTIDQNNGEHRLLKHKNIFDAGEEETDQSTKSSKKESKSQAKTYQCLGQKRVVCGGKKGKKLYLCHHEGEGNFRSICMRKKKISGHLRNHPDDYCGKCEAEHTTTMTCRWKGMPPDATTDAPPPLCGLTFTKVAVCHYNEGVGQYEDLCVAPHEALDNLNNYPEDFCGRCDQLSFEEKEAEMDYLNMVMDTDFNDLAQFLNDDGTAIDELARFTSAVRNEIPLGMREAITDADIIRPLLKRHSDGVVVPSGRSLYPDPCTSQLLQFVHKIITLLMAVIVLFFPIPATASTKVLGLSGKIAKSLIDSWSAFLSASPRIIWFLFKEGIGSSASASSASAWSGLEFVIYFDAIVKFLGNFQLGLIIKSIGGALVEVLTPWDWLMISADLIITLAAAWATVGASLGIKMLQFTIKLTDGAPVALAFLDFIQFIFYWKQVEEACWDVLTPLDVEVYCSDRLNVGTCEDLIIIQNSQYKTAANPCHLGKKMELVHQYDDSNGVYHCETYQRCCWRPTEDDPLPRCMVDLVGVDEVNGIKLVETDPELGVQVSGVVGYCTNRDTCFEDKEDIPVFITDSPSSSVIISPGRQSGIKEGSCTGCCLGEMECSKEYQDGYTQKGNCIRLHDPSFTCPYSTSSDVCDALSPTHRCCLQVKTYASLSVSPDPEVERFRVGVGYTFKLAAFDIQPQDPVVAFAWSFTNNVDDMISACCVYNENGRAEHVVEHTFTSADTYTLLAHVRPQNSLGIIAEQTMEMTVTAEDCPPTIPPTKCTIFYTNGEHESGECLTESDCNSAEGKRLVENLIDCIGFESKCGVVGCCVEPSLEIESPGLENAMTGVEYTFNFIAKGIASTVGKVDFAWSFTGDVNGMNSAGFYEAEYGRVMYTVDHTYNSQGTYNLIVQVRTALTSEVLVEKSVDVIVSGPREGVLIVGNDDSFAVLSCSQDQFVAQGEVAMNLEIGNIIMHLGGDDSICQECLPLIRIITNITEDQTSGTQTFTTTLATLSDVFEDDLLEEFTSDVEVELLVGCDNKKTPLNFITSCKDWQAIESNGDCVWTNCNVGVDGDPVNCFQCRDECDNGCGAKDGLINHSGDFVLYDFGPACCVHDFCYSAYSFFSKDECDEMFYHEMLKACPTIDLGVSISLEFPIGVIPSSCQSMAVLFYMLVHLFGSGAAKDSVIAQLRYENSGDCGKPSKPPGYLSGVFGDPHLSTFDRLNFDCQAAGEFVTVTSLETPEFMIQERFTSIDSEICSLASVSTGVAIQDVDTPTVQVSTSNLVENATNVIRGCPIDFFVDGTSKSFSDEVDPSISVKVAGSQISIIHPETWVSVNVRVQSSTSFGCHLLVQVFIPRTYRTDETILGLLGTPNGNRNDDWRSPNGTVIPTAASVEDMILSPAYQYCVENWCVRSVGDSIFVHETEESFDEINACDKDYVGDIERALENPPEDMVAVCGSNMFCLVDGLCGKLDDAMNALVNDGVVEADQAEADQCSIGYEGDLCSQCAPGYELTVDGLCITEVVPATTTTMTTTTTPNMITTTTTPEQSHSSSGSSKSAKPSKPLRARPHQFVSDM